MNLPKVERQTMPFDGIDHFGAGVREGRASLSPGLPGVKGFKPSTDVIVAQGPPQRSLDQMNDGTAQKEADDDADHKTDSPADQAGPKLLQMFSEGHC